MNNGIDDDRLTHEVGFLFRAKMGIKKRERMIVPVKYDERLKFLSLCLRWLLFITVVRLVLLSAALLAIALLIALLTTTLLLTISLLVTALLIAALPATTLLTVTLLATLLTIALLITTLLPPAFLSSTALLPVTLLSATLLLSTPLPPAILPPAFLSSASLLLAALLHPAFFVGFLQTAQADLTHHIHEFRFHFLRFVTGHFNSFQFFRNDALLIQ